MGRNFEREFFEQFEDSSAKGKPLDSLSESYADDAKQDEFAELSELILRCEGQEIDQEQLTRLQDWLLNDRRAKEYYVEYGYLCAALNILLNEKQGISFPKHILTV